MLKKEISGSEPKCNGFFLGPGPILPPSLMEIMETNHETWSKNNNFKTDESTSLKLVAVDHGPGRSVSTNEWQPCGLNESADATWRESGSHPKVRRVCLRFGWLCWDL